jgi:tetratricopeptide (TPR) repeat protein
LFIERAVYVQGDFELTDDNAAVVAQICGQLDGLPLAIELAAARVKFLTPEAILSRLESRLELLTGGPRDVPARQRTLRSAIEWSYDLLEEEGKQLFRRLAVFVGGLTLAAIGAVCDPGVGSQESGVGVSELTHDSRLLTPLRIDILDEVQSLVDNSLLRQARGADGEPRFIMLETIREYSREKAEESGEIVQLQREYGLYFMKLVEEAEPQLRGARQQEWLDRLEDEHDNLRAALQWARESGNDEAVEIGLRTAAALWQFWSVRGYLSEGWEQLRSILDLRFRILDLSRSTKDDPKNRILKSNVAKALNGAGILADLQGDYGSARPLLEESLALEREVGDKKGMAASLNNLGSVAQQQGDHATARSMYEESLALKRELGDKFGVSISLGNLGLVTQQQGDYVAARSMYKESLSLARELEDKGGVAITLNNLGLVAHLQGEHATARSMYEESLALKRELGDKRGIAISLSNVGLVALEQGDYTSARSHFEESLTLRRELGDKWGIALSLAGLGGVAVAPGSTAEPGEIARGARLLGAVEALLESIGSVLEAEDRVPYERAVASASALLGAAEFERLWAEGHAMSLERAIEYALGEAYIL